jgi:hypothetical protein
VCEVKTYERLAEEWRARRDALEDVPYKAFADY